jgi:hypothetical protein
MNIIDVDVVFDFLIHNQHLGLKLGSEQDIIQEV